MNGVLARDKRERAAEPFGAEARLLRGSEAKNERLCGVRLTNFVNTFWVLSRIRFYADSHCYMFAALANNHAPTSIALSVTQLSTSSCSTGSANCTSPACSLNRKWITTDATGFSGSTSTSLRSQSCRPVEKGANTPQVCVPSV